MLDKAMIRDANGVPVHIYAMGQVINIDASEETQTYTPDKDMLVKITPIGDCYISTTGTATINSAYFPDLMVQFVLLKKGVALSVANGKLNMVECV